MNKSDLAAHMAEKAGTSKRAAEQLLDAAIEAIEDALSEGERVQLVGFGTFEVKLRAARTGRNPKTREAVSIMPRRVPVFSPGKRLKGKVHKLPV